MNSFDIFVDSSANLTDEMVARTGIKVIAYRCLINGKETECYVEGMPFEKVAKNHYANMLNGAEIKTSLVGEERIIEAFTPSLEQGKDVLMVTISAGISGTYNQAVNAAKELKAKFPDRKILISDSANASFGQGLQALHVAGLRDMGASIESCAKWIEDNKYKMNSYVTVSDLKYLRKGGRISAAVAFAGTLLNIKPLLRADGGSPAKLGVFAKERGRKKAIEAIAKYFGEKVVNPENQTIAIAHGDCEEDALKLAELIKGYGARDIVIEYYDLCTGSHVGPGTVALFFMGKDRRAPSTAKEAHPQGRAVTQKI